MPVRRRRSTPKEGHAATFPLKYTRTVQTVDELNEQFQFPDVLTFDEPHAGMPRARITTPGCTAELYLQGAHLTQWQPAGEQPVLFLSENSAYTPGKAIRGGIPVVFPWFASPETSPVHTSPGSPQHGFARIWPWTLRFAALAGDNVHLSMTLDQTEGIRALGFTGFQLGYELTLGRTLSSRLVVANTGAENFFFEEALHAYLAVSNSGDVTVEGLQNTEFLDKTEHFQRKTQPETLLRFAGETDRPYLNTTAPLTVRDPGLRRCLALGKSGSRTTVTWNPGAELAAKLADLTPGAWQRFVCLETANVGEDAITLRPGEAHTMDMHLSVEPL